MKGIIIVENNSEGYLGFDRNYSYFNSLEQDSDMGFPIIDDLFVPLTYIKEVSEYSALKDDGNKSIIVFSSDELVRKEYKMIGIDCGFLYDREENYYIGFSTIANEVLRLGNEICDAYREKLNQYRLFPSLEVALNYIIQRDKLLSNEGYNFERAFTDITSVYIYKYKT